MVVADAPRNHSQFNWFMQSRAYPLYNESTGLYSYWHESSRLQDMANVVADILLASRCSLIVANFESQFPMLWTRAGCSRHGECPAIQHLGDCQLKQPKYTVY